MPVLWVCVCDAGVRVLSVEKKGKGRKEIKNRPGVFWAASSFYSDLKSSILI